MVPILNVNCGWIWINWILFLQLLDHPFHGKHLDFSSYVFKLVYIIVNLVNLVNYIYIRLYS